MVKKELPKDIFIVRNRLTLKAAISEYSDAATYSHHFLEISPENYGDRILLLVKLQTDYPG